jgi:hypothetical protein
VIHRLSVAGAIAGGMIAAAIFSAPTIGAEPDDDKYTQTWPKPYSQTTCLEYRTEMTANQAWVMAADMLTGARDKLPSDAMASDFAKQMFTACEPDIAAAETMVDVGASVLVLDSALKTPHFQS